MAIIVQAISETAVVAGKTKELAMMDAAFETWQAIEGKKREAINRSRAEHLPALCKAEMESQESFRKAKRAWEASEIARGGIILRSDLKGYQRALQSIRQVIEKAPGELGARANPMDKNFGIVAVREWIETRFSREVEAAFSEIEKLKNPHEVSATTGIL